jgi:transcriptional regulator with XRE-family HTH domain
MEWVDDQVESDARLASEVSRLLSEMRLEQELVALRERRGLSQREAAKLIHATQPYVAKLESGRIQNLGVATLVKYAHALGGRLTIDIKAKRAARRSVGAGTTRRSARPRGVAPGRKRRRR